MLCAATFAIVSVIWPVFGTPGRDRGRVRRGDRDRDAGGEHVAVLGMAELLIDGDEPHRVGQPVGLATASTPVNGGTIIEYANGRMRPLSSSISPSRASLIAVFGRPSIP